MKEIKVQFDFKITEKHHSLYNSYFKCPPKNIIYTKAEFKGINRKNYSLIRKFYKFLKKRTKISSNFERRIKDFLRKKKEVDLIHFANHIGKTKKPFVADYEHFGSFIGNKYYDKKITENAKRLLLKKNLKFLLPISHIALESFKKNFKDLNKKIKQEVVYPTIYIPKKYLKKNKKEKIVVFGGSANIITESIFYHKGGYETLLAFDKLSQKFPHYKFIFLGYVPKRIKIPKRENLIIKKILPLEKLYELLNKSEIFIQPNYAVPATIFLIAMYFKLPIITYDTWGNKEYVSSNSGILLKPKINITNEFGIPTLSENNLKKIRENSGENSKKIIKAVEKLIKNEKLRIKMGEEGYKKVTKGKFSIEKRNKKLRKIYEEAVK